jgi:hypothetical protein
MNPYQSSLPRYHDRVLMLLKKTGCISTRLALAGVYEGA